MDTKIVTKKNKTKYLIIGSVLLLFLGFIIYKSATTKRSLTVEKNTIAIKAVSNTSFEDFISIQAKVTPLNEMLINIVEGGAIQEIYVENGDFIKKGQILVRISNPNTELSYMRQETAIVEQINNLSKAKLDLRNQELNMSKDLIRIQHDYTNAKNKYELDKKLFSKDIIAKNDWINTQENYRFQEERMQIIKKSIAKEKEANRLQINQIQQAVNSIQNNLDVLRKNKENFTVRAPKNGRLSSFNPILGKTYNQGESIGKIDPMNAYKLTAEVDEFYLNKVANKQIGTVNYKDKLVKVYVSKVMPEIKSGRFTVELIFKEKLTLKQGTTFGIRLSLSGKKDALVIPKGSFYTDTSGEWIFVVNDNKATKRTIKLGLENPLYYQVISGLSEGEKVITSSYKEYKNIEEINLE